MDFLKLLACALCAYLLGSLSFGIIVTKIIIGDDIRNYGSGNAGSTNAYRVLGAKAIFVVIGDVLKGIAAMLIGRAIAGADGQVCAYMFVLFGHAYPIFYGLRGGKGVLTTVASLAMISVPAAAMFGVVFFTVFFLTRYVSLSSIIAAATIPVFLFLFAPPEPAMLTAAMLMSAFVIVLHRENILRLLHKEERKFSFKRK